MLVKKLILVSLSAALSGGAAAAQQSAPPAAPLQTATAPTDTAAQVPDGGTPTYVHPETAQQRRARLGTVEDPGTNPDPNKHYWRFGHSFHIDKFERKWAVSDQNDPAFIRPFAPVNIVKELYQQNEKWVWVWMADPTPEETSTQPPLPEMSAEQTKFYQDIRTEFGPLDVPDSGKRIRFVESSQGLPGGGSYRNGLAVADMNEDGCPDIITPPQRAGNGIPEIYLGDCKGHWTGWATTTWPYRLDYGTVVAADFNKDGHIDLAFGVHLNGVRVLLGDGKGHFTDASKGMNGKFPTRRIAVADVDRDGYPDIIALSEGPAASTRGEAIPVALATKMVVYLNRDKGRSWQPEAVASQEHEFGGDWLSVGKFNSDPYPDFVAASAYFNGPDILWASTGKNQWTNVGGGTTVPLISYYFANAAGRFSSKKLDDAVISYVRTWPSNVDSRIIPPPKEQTVTGIDRIVFSGKEARRIPVVRWATNRPIWALAAADLDGDGNLDLIYTRFEPRTVEILLGDGKGNFRHATAEGIPLPVNTNYDIKVADVNGDGRPDVILAYENTETTAFAARNGSVHVFLNQGAVEPPRQAKK